MIEEFALFSGTGDEAIKKASKLVSQIGSLPQSIFTAANKITDQLLKKGWWYQGETYCLHDMLKKRGGNCLGLSCLFGLVLESNGFKPDYELVIGPEGFQQGDEKAMLEGLIRGDYFSFDQPLMPERQYEGQKLYFATLGHPRLVLDGEVFETTALAHQEPSTIVGETVRLLLKDQLLGLVLFERGHQARVARKPNFVLAKDFLVASLVKDPQNQDVWAELASIALSHFDDDGYNKACQSYYAVERDDSQYFLERYFMLHDEGNLDRVLKKNPTNMRAWTIKNFVLEKDLRTQRANCAVAAQCIARSEVLDLGDFYSIHADILARIFPDDALSLVEGSFSKRTNIFNYNLALAMLGNLDRLKAIKPNSPIEEVRFAFAIRHLHEDENPWREVCRNFGDSELFQSVVSSLERQWEMVTI